MKRSSLFILFGTFLTLSLISQTTQQSYFKWTTLPFSKEEFAQRRGKLVNILQKQGKSGLVVIPARDGFSTSETFRQADDFYYYTRLEIPNAILAIDLLLGSSTLYVPKRDQRFENSLRPNDFPGRPLLDDNNLSTKAGIIVKSMKEFSNLMDQKKLTSETIFVNCSRQGPVTFLSEDYFAEPIATQILLNALEKRHEGLRYENIYGSIAALRMIISPAEQAIMRKAVDITVEGIKTAAKEIHPGVDERSLEGVLEADFKKNGSQRLAFASIIKSGPNSLWPWRVLATHYNRRNRILEDGDLVIFDVGCEYNQYVSDVGRTFPVSGKFSERQKEILLMQIEIADQIIEFIKPGISFLDIKKLTDRFIPGNAKKYMQVGLFFGHHLGLSAGDPNLATATLQPGMIFTVEPWYYNHNEQIAVFTEDVILVTADGCEILSKDLVRQPEELEKLMIN